MGRKRLEIAKSRLAKQLIESYDIKTAQDIQAALKDLLGETIESMLKEDLDEHLDYKYGQTPT
ncbi:IS256 family transposase, partial [Helcococcus bovis]